MSIATEVQRIQTAKVDIKTAIETAGVVVDDSETIGAYASKVDEVYNKGYEKGKSEGGGNNHYDLFWDTFQDYGNRTDYSYAFRKNTWSAEIFKPKYPFGQITNAERMFMDNTTQLTEINVTLDLTNCKSTSASLMFGYCTGLVTVKDIIVNKELNMQDLFRSCGNLVNLGISGELGMNTNLMHCGKLSDESINRVIGCLGDMTGSTAPTLTLHKDIKAKLTESQIATITGKNWTLA